MSGVENGAVHDKGNVEGTGESGRSTPPEQKAVKSALTLEYSVRMRWSI